MEEKQSKIFIAIGFVIVLLAGLLLGYMLGKYEKKKVDEPVKIENKSYSLGIYQDRRLDDRYKVIYNKDDLSNFNINEDLDFTNSKYVIVESTYDECSESDVKVKNYDVKENILNVNFTYTGSCGVCAPKYIYYLFRVDKDVNIKDINVKSSATNDYECDPYVSYKPLIYLYPTKKLNVEVKLGKSELLTTTYPKYVDSWKVVANPNGDLVDSNGRHYYGLYWEGINNIKEDFSTGFVVKGEDTIKFLEEKLAILGLNEKEANEFIIYWLPKLESNKYNFIHFIDIDTINNEMPLEINPNPDTIIRVLMAYKPLDEYMSVKEQQLVSVNRKGFTVVEWGGTKID